MDFRVQVWKPVWKVTFLLWNRVRIWKTRQHTVTKNSKECPGPLIHPRAKNLSVSKFAHMMKYKLLGQNCAEIYLRYPQLSFLIAKNSATRLLLSNSLKGKSRHDQFFQQNKSWMCIDYRLNLCSFIVPNSFKKLRVKAPVSPDGWEFSVTRAVKAWDFAPFKSSAARCLQTGSCYRSMAFHRWVGVLPYISHLAIWRSKGCKCKMVKSFCWIGEVRKQAPVV